MFYEQVENKVILKKIGSFDIEQTLECGQCFRFYKIAKHNYIVIAKKRVLNIVQNEDEIIFYPTSIKEFENLWIDYFDLKRDYDIIKQRLAKIDKYLFNAVKFAPGIRILNQDPWECLISFIISQNKQIPHIKKIVENISKRFGRPISSIENKEYYTFPTVEKLMLATEEDIRECKAGFRAPYIIDACIKIKNGEVNLENLKDLSYEKAKKELMKIKGVGPKIADCVLLFSIGKREAFPVDVWVKRVMEYFYFNQNVQLKDIQNFAKKYFGELAGYAQQYLFYYARELKLGK
ncbi:DNA-3-methyladenine glycosylase family protein [Defluviitalea phaphyphila]|uniref:DNA-3-methyladenine glycosylase family protein n=1 Tax=Defluviitalea phaphyphila TaxID=1473580 RepID=UPI0007316DDC|nr:DNA glycosylase [Defluviitalea phaphyphila]